MNIVFGGAAAGSRYAADARTAQHA